MRVFQKAVLETNEGLDGKTPAEACGIEIKGDNKWITLIQNASQSQKGKSEMNYL